MIRLRSTLVVLLCGLLGGLVVLPATPAQARADTITVSLRQAISNLPVASEVRTGYDRSKFVLWIDADGDCRDTRDEVLAAESLVAVSGCDVQAGSWKSFYDGLTFTDSSGLDIDHVVPLAEAWDSGARRWNATTRTRYANDLVDGRSLIAVSASSNRSKGDRDPAEWLPTYGKCRYLRMWVAVKTRWSLSVDSAEKSRLVSLSLNCTNPLLTVRKASIGLASTTGTTGTTSGGMDPIFATCTEAKANGYGPYVQGVDPEYAYYYDADHDGIVCE